MQVPDRAFLGIARITAPHPGRVGLHRPDLLADRIRLLTHEDGVAVGLRHLLAIRARQTGLRRQQLLRLRQDHLAAALDVAVKPLPIANGDILLFLEQRSRRFEGFLIALLEKASPQAAVQLGVLLAHLGDGRFSLLLEARITTIEMVEPPGDFAGDLHVGHLVRAHRHQAGPVHQDVRALEQRVPQETIGGEVLFLELFLLILVARNPFKPAQRRDHRQQQVQFRVLGHMGLDEQCRGPWVDARGQPVDHHVPDALLNGKGVFVHGRQRVPVRHEEEALVLVLELGPVGQHTMVMA